jgi:TatD DNase family protein
MAENKIRYIETHCHLDMLKTLDPVTASLEASKLGVELINTIAVSPDNLDTVCELASNHDKIYGTQGVHPHEAKLFNEQVEKKIRFNLNENSKLVAVGEIGLDYHYEHSPREKQKEVFERQLQIAIDLDLPVVIHSRDAEEDTINILKNFVSQKKFKAVIHSFTAKLELAEFALSEGLFLGFNGIITFKNAHEVRDALKITPAKQLLFETDAPFLSPTPFRGKENSPLRIPIIAQACADVLQLELEDLSRQVYDNSLNLFSYPQG